MEGYNLKTIKTNNRSSILYLLNEHKKLSRKQIASYLNLTRAAVSKITASLLDDKLIKEEEEIGNGVGRKEVMLSLTLDSYTIFGITFESDYITLFIGKLNGDLVDKITLDFVDDFNLIKEEIKKYYLYNKSKYNLFACGVSIIGHLDRYGVFQDVSLKDELEKIIDIKIIIRNNVKAFSLASTIYSNLKKDDNVLVFKWGPGIGSSFISKGVVLSGDDTGTTEIGHIIVDVNGKKCRCGRTGCLETLTSLKVIEEDARKIGYTLDINEILSSKNQEILKILDTKIDLVCLALLNASTILNASKIVLFGSVFLNKEFTSHFIERFKKYIAFDNKKTVELSMLNEKASYIGSIAIVSKKLFFESELKK